MDKYIGRLLDNRYEILEIIGVGGMAVVYKALDKVLDRYVAIKILKDEFAHDEEFRKRFANESHAVAKLSHNNIVSVFDVSRTDVPQYIVMELIEGITLKEYLTKKGALTWQETLFFTQQIAKALEHAHSRGIIHQDIKPHNICLLRDGTVKVTDFGIARFEKNQETRVIQEAIGSVHYISPEQAKGSAIDHRADIYSLGVMMYEMLTGRVPFDGDTPLAIVMQHINAVPLPPSEIVDGVPKGMDDVVMRAMCPVLNKRYMNAADVYNDLEKLKHQPGIRFDNAPSRQAAVDGETVVLPKLNQEIKHEQEKVLRTEPVAPPRYEWKPEEKPVRVRKKGFFGRLVESPVAMAILGVLLCVVIAGVALIKMMGLGGELILVPRFIDSNIADILSNAEYQEQFVFEQQSQVNNEVDPGTILDQSPAANESVKKGSTITVVVAEHAQEEAPPAETYVIDDLAEKSLTFADIILRKNGMEYKIEHQASLDIEKDHVITTIPAAGTSITKDEVITLVVSLGPEGIPVMVPNLLGSTLSEAQTMLADAHLEVKVNTKKSDAPENQVIEQSIEAETEVDAGTTVEITISLGSGMTPPPQEPSQPAENPNDEPIQIPGMDDPEASGQATVSFRLPADEESAHVVVYIDGNQVHEQTYDTTEQRRVSLDLSAARGERMVYIDINGERDERIVNFR